MKFAWLDRTTDAERNSLHTTGIGEAGDMEIAAYVPPGLAICARLDVPAKHTGGRELQRSAKSHSDHR